MRESKENFSLSYKRHLCKTMAHNLRRRFVGKMFVKDDDASEALDKASSNEEDHTSYDEDEYSVFQHSSSSDEDYQNASMDQWLSTQAYFLNVHL